jgi:hypothetical protein
MCLCMHTLVQFSFVRVFTSHCVVPRRMPPKYRPPPPTDAMDAGLAEPHPERKPSKPPQFNSFLATWFVTDPTRQPTLPSYCSAIRGQLEIAPRTGAMHWQLYVQLNSRKKVSDIQRDFFYDEKVHLDKPRGIVRECLNYCDNRRQPGHQHRSGPHKDLWTGDKQGVLSGTTITVNDTELAVPYIDVGVFMNETIGDDRPPVDDEGKIDWHGVSDCLRSDPTKRSLLEQCPEALGKHPTGINMIASMNRKPPEHRNDVFVVLIWGHPGTGKTHLATHTRQPDGTYVRKPSSQLFVYPGGDKEWWGDKEGLRYDGQPEILINEFTGSGWPLSRLKQILDIGECLLPVKGGHEYANYSIVWITTNMNPQDLYRNAQNPGDREAFHSRIGLVINVNDIDYRVRKRIRAADANLILQLANDPRTTVNFASSAVASVLQPYLPDTAMPIQPVEKLKLIRPFLPPRPTQPVFEIQNVDQTVGIPLVCHPSDVHQLVMRHQNIQNIPPAPPLGNTNTRGGAGSMSYIAQNTIRIGTAPPKPPPRTAPQNRPPNRPPEPSPVWRVPEPGSQYEDSTSERSSLTEGGIAFIPDGLALEDEPVVENPHLSRLVIPSRSCSKQSGSSNRNKPSDRVIARRPHGAVHSKGLRNGIQRRLRWCKDCLSYVSEENFLARHADRHIARYLTHDEDDRVSIGSSSSSAHSVVSSVPRSAFLTLLPRDDDVSSGTVNSRATSAVRPHTHTTSSQNSDDIDIDA